MDIVRKLGSLAISPASANTAIGGTVQYTAIASYTDGTSADVTSTVSWFSQDPSIATIAAGGLAKGIAAGSTGIAASIGSVTSNTATLSVA